MWGWGAAADAFDLGFALHGAAVWLGASLLLHWIAPMPTRHEGRIDAVPEPNSATNGNPPGAT